MRIRLLTVLPLLTLLLGLAVAPAAVAQQARTTYTVRAGDTLYRIARNHGTTVAQIKAWNELAGDRINVGQTLIVGETVETGTPRPMDTPVRPATNPADGYHTVSQGETLYSIARRYSLDVSQLRALNNLADDNLRIGQTLRLRANVVPSGMTVPATDVPVHVVRSGETLTTIARAYALSVTTLRELNDLPSDASLRVGQRLLVGAAPGDTALPTPAPISAEMQRHTVLEGETLYSIARQYDTTVDVLADLNGLDGYAVQLGQRLRVPETVTRPIPTPPSTERAHIVQSGESLYNVAQLYSTSVEELQRLNRLPALDVSPGQRLLLPEATEEALPNNVLEGVHVVQPGETLPSVAARYGLAVEALREKNGTATEPLTAGEVLVLPDVDTLPSYQVRGGDTLTSIARAFQISVADLRAANDLTDNRIAVGQVLRIPGRGDLPDVLTQPDETGVVVVYPASFEGRMTASGERYDPAKLTASHPSLPLGSSVLLRNPATGQRVLVRISDRRPFGETYLMEISQAAAATLGLTNQNGQTVEVRVSK